MAKKKQTRKIVRLVSASGDTYYTTRRGDGEKLELWKFDSNERMRALFKEFTKSLGRNEVKKRK
jgi:ribosomal protein L33